MEKNDEKETAGKLLQSESRFLSTEHSDVHVSRDECFQISLSSPTRDTDMQTRRQRSETLAHLHAHAHRRFRSSFDDAEESVFCPLLFVTFFSSLLKCRNRIWTACQDGDAVSRDSRAGPCKTPPAIYTFLYASLCCWSLFSSVCPLSLSSPLIFFSSSLVSSLCVLAQSRPTCRAS
uniref:Uncharacterized protein n=1 Tax=Toxoplasma gondii COUG TaxID=1074873 RepID=A0A2G8Y531_TOXGO|nr:hypothetical protein TGCOUG_205615 [Toxoplasma gondii COUG]